MADRRSYGEKLRDPKWQRRRLEILERAGWCCERCNRGDLELQVHHRFYRRGVDPWDYDDEALRALCVECHPIEQAQLDELTHLLGLVDVDMLLGFARAIVADRRKATLVVENYEQAAGAAAGLCAERGIPADAELVIDAVICRGAADSGLAHADLRTLIDALFERRSAIDRDLEVGWRLMADGCPNLRARLVAAAASAAEN